VRYLTDSLSTGELAEWSKARHWKCRVP
jgi:hypothetical protein